MELYEDVVTTIIILMTLLMTGIAVRTYRTVASIVEMRNEVLKNKETLKIDLQNTEERTSTYQSPTRR